MKIQMFPHHHLVSTPTHPLFIGIPQGLPITPSGSQIKEAGSSQKALEPP